MANAKKLLLLQMEKVKPNGMNLNSISNLHGGLTRDLRMKKLVFWLHSISRESQKALDHTYWICILMKCFLSSLSIHLAGHRINIADVHPIYLFVLGPDHGGSCASRARPFT